MRTPYERKEIQMKDTDVESVRAVNRDTYDCCGYCGSKLLFTHDLNLNFFEVVENSRCTGCGVSYSPKKFSLQ